jgi:hypothetical protein
MNTYVTFVADRFNQKERRPNFINDDNFGEDLAQWIIAKLSQVNDILADPDPLQEDWGWLVYVSVDQVSGNIGLASYQVETPEGIKDGWMCFLEMPKNKKPSLLLNKAKADEYNCRIQEVSEKILRDFNAILSSSPSISQIRWHNESDFMSGNEDNWTVSPLEQN